MSRSDNKFETMLMTLIAFMTWVSVAVFPFTSVHQSPAAPDPIADYLPFPQPRPILHVELAPVVELELYRHVHERVTRPTTGAQRGRVELASRSTSRPRFDEWVPVKFQPLVATVAATYELDPRLLAAMVQYESNWDTNAIGPARDSGLMQIIPSTARWIASEMGLKEYDILDPETNLMMGAWCLRHWLNYYGDLETALIVYNGGPGALTKPKWDPYDYARRVISIRDAGRYDV